MFSGACRFSTVRQRIQQDLIAAMKAKDTTRSGILRQLQAQLTNREKTSKTTTPTDADLIGAIRECSEHWQKAIKEYGDLLASNPSRQEDIRRMMAKEEAELAVIQEYLPTGYTAEELDASIKEVISGLPDKPPKLGPVMKALLGRLDLTRVSRKDLAAAITKHIV